MNKADKNIPALISHTHKKMYVFVLLPRVSVLGIYPVGMPPKYRMHMHKLIITF